jgi:hypothetical protein
MYYNCEEFRYVVRAYPISAIHKNVWVSALQLATLDSVVNHTIRLGGGSNDFRGLYGKGIGKREMVAYHGS